jgi:hypothetical protein
MTASEKILLKTLVATGLSSSEIDLVAAGLKDRAFFSSRVESIRFLQGAQKGLGDLLANARNEDGAITSRAQIVSDLMRAARENGIATGRGGLTDPGSAKRAAVIVDTNAGLARGHVSWAAGSTKGARMAYPAQELVRITPAKQPRVWTALWKAAGGKLPGGRMIALKTDDVWRRLSRFGVPYPPFDYGSGMGVSDVSFEECVSLGILADDWAPGDENPVEDFNATLEADLDFKGAGDPEWKFLQDSFGDQVRHEGGKVKWQGDVIGDAFKTRAADPDFKRAVRLGAPTPEALSAAPAGAPLAGQNLTMQSDHLYHELKRHIGDAETHAGSVPLAESDLALIPHAWRRPDRVTADPKTGALFFELKSADGNWYRLVVKAFPGETKFLTFYKVKAGASGLPVTGY